jgi:molecular chaperone GrpE
VFDKTGVEAIDPAGTPFDMNEHQAVAHVDDPSLPDGTVRDVYQKGYRMGGRVIRPAMVTVSKGGAPAPAQG